MRKMLLVLIAMVLPFLTFLASGVAASSDITYLGKSTSSVPLRPSRPLAGFQHIGPFVRQGTKPELLFLGSMVDGNSAVERWAVVKALRQFGAFIGVSPAETRACGLQGTPIKVQCAPAGDPLGVPTGLPTFNLESARYRSRYVAFTALDLVDSNLNIASHLSAVERQLFTRYLENTSDLQGTTPTFANLVWNTALSPVAQESRRTFPLVSIGGYLETEVGVAIYGDIESNLGAYLPFDTVQRTLATGRPTGSVPRSNGNQEAGKVPGSLIPDINAETNVITGLICHADGRRPSSVCGRSVIKQLLKHMK